MGANLSIQTALASLTTVEISYSLPRSQARRKNETDLLIERLARFRGASLVGTPTETVVSGNRIVRTFTFVTSVQTVARYFKTQLDALSHKNSQKAFLDASSATNLDSYPQVVEYFGKQFISPDDYAVALDLDQTFATSKLADSTLKIGAYGYAEPYGTLTADSVRVSGPEPALTGTSNLLVQARGSALVTYRDPTADRGANILVRSDGDVTIEANLTGGDVQGSVILKVEDVPASSEGVQGGLVRMNDVILPRVGTVTGTLRATNAFSPTDAQTLHTNWTPHGVFVSTTVSGGSTVLSPSAVAGGVILRTSGASSDTLPMAPMLYNALTMRGFTKQIPNTINYGVAVTPHRSPLFKTLYPYNRNVAMLGQSADLLARMYVPEAIETDFLANKVNDLSLTLGSSQARVSACAADAHGNLFCVGTTDVVIADWSEGFGSERGNGFVIKYDVTGEVCWVCYAWGAVLRGVALNDTTGDIVVVGETFAEQHNGAISCARIGLLDGFVGTIDSSGFLARTAAGPQNRPPLRASSSATTRARCSSPAPPTATMMRKTRSWECSTGSSWCWARGTLRSTPFTSARPTA